MAWLLFSGKEEVPCCSSRVYLKDGKRGYEKLLGGVEGVELPTMLDEVGVIVGGACMDVEES